ncbi:MAG: bifunctional tetrahydrofolate synthase/dihydrofolate synthase [Sodalis sp. (in: enterobacteria)]
MENLLIPQPSSSLATWIYYLERLHSKPIELGLQRVRKVATDLNLLRPAPWVITVGGTNGKGTTCRLLEAILLASGMRVGVYSSPHLFCYTERVRIQGAKLSKTAHSKAMAFIEAGRKTTSLTYFEFGTLAALHLFQQMRMDVVILEVGLGGQLDATNIVDADVAVITSIAIDHTDWLGSNRTSIAREKAGIFRRNRPAVVGEPDRPAALATAVDESGAKLYARDRDWWYHENDQYWHWWDTKCTIKELPIPLIPLQNAATTVAAINRLPFTIPEIAIRKGLREARLPGRFQCIGRAPLIILDVAHNPHAAAYLAQRLALIARKGKVRAVVGMLADKDIAGTLACLRGQVDVWYCASLNGSRATCASQLVAYLDSDAQRFENVAAAWHQAIGNAATEDIVLVFGSFYTVASVMALADRKQYVW